MTNQAMTAQLERIEKEVRSVRSFLISVAGKDKEGNYNSKFVREIQKAANEDPIQKFKNAESFLQALEEA